MFMTEKQVEMLRKQYPPGTRLCCDCMPVMKWDNGRSLSLIPGVDSFHTVEQTDDMTEDMDEGPKMV